jgi:desulfoferrodoxin (superoxide reductase-like protein)
MYLEKDKIEEIENKIDRVIFDSINPEYPLYKYIYHLNLAYNNLLIETGALFSTTEKFYNFSLSVNIHLAYKKLKAEGNFDYIYDKEMHYDCLSKIMNGFLYALLCEEFPKLYSGKSKMKIDSEGVIKFESLKYPRSQYYYLHEYSKRNVLRYVLQYIAGETFKLDKEDRAWRLTRNYLNYWAEQLNAEDFTNYSRLEWGGVNLFLTLASMRRWIDIYDNDFDFDKIHASDTMIKFTHKWKSDLPPFIDSNIESVEKVLDDYTYKPRGEGYFPKILIHEAPIVRTSNDYMFINPFSILFTPQDTRLLSYLRKLKNSEYLEIKDKIKERHIPFIEGLVKNKFKNVKSIVNFDVKKPNSNNKREVDILFIDEEEELGLYIEVKYFYNPISYNECKRLDEEFRTAFAKLPKQLKAIESDWSNIKRIYDINCDIKHLYGIILSYEYTGLDVEIHPEYALVNTNIFYESLGFATNLRELFVECKDTDNVYQKAKIIGRPFEFKFGEYTFETEIECFDPRFEILLKKSQYNQATNIIKFSERIDSSNAKESFESALKLMLEELGSE